MIELLRVQRKRFIMTIEICPSVLQKMEMIQKLDLTILVIVSDQISPRFNKQGDEGTKAYLPRSQVDQMISINEKDQGQTTKTIKS